MTCKQIRIQLADYSAQRLAPFEAGEVRSHLDRCNACALFFREEAALARGLERLAVVEPSADMWSRVSAGLDAPSRESSRRFAWKWNRRSLAALMTGATAVAGLTAVTYLKAPSPQPVPTDPKVQIANRMPTLPVISRDVNLAVDDPMADQMDNLFAAVDQMTGKP